MSENFPRGTKGEMIFRQMDKGAQLRRNTVRRRKAANRAGAAHQRQGQDAGERGVRGDGGTCLAGGWVGTQCGGSQAGRADGAPTGKIIPLPSTEPRATFAHFLHVLLCKARAIILSIAHKSNPSIFFRVALDYIRQTVKTHENTYSILDIPL